MRIDGLFAGLAIRGPGGGVDDPDIADVTEDSRTVTPGSLFIARSGAKTDGRAYIADAVRAGAVAILTDDATIAAQAGVPTYRVERSEFAASVARVGERFFGSPSSKLRVVGVTGTNGKTTVTYLMHQMLNALGVRCGLMGTVTVDDGEHVARATHTTPPALGVSRTLAKMAGSGCAAAVMEVSSHALHQGRVAAIEFAAAVFTNLTGDHLDYHGTMENYGAAKAMLFAGLGPGATAVVNVMDPEHSRMVRACRARIVRCWLDRPLAIRREEPADGVCTARVVGAGKTHSELELAGPWGAGGRAGRVRVSSPLIGEFNVMNALQAFATIHAVFGPGTATGLNAQNIANAFAGVRAPPGRLQPASGDGDDIAVIVDYAHTDDALRRVIAAVGATMRPRGGDGGRLWCVFGCGGDRDRTKRPRMGAAAAELADRVIITNDNPRTESPAEIILGVRAGIPAPSLGKVVIEPDRERAIRLAVCTAAPGDTVLIAGKGHEDYQILPDPGKPGSTITRHFDDREVAAAALAERRRNSGPGAVSMAGSARSG